MWENQATYQWIFLQSPLSPYKRHGHRIQSIDSLICLMYHPLRLVVGMLPATCRFLWRFVVSPKWSTISHIPTDSGAISSLSWWGTIDSILPGFPRSAGFWFGRYGYVLVTWMLFLRKIFLNCLPVEFWSM